MNNQKRKLFFADLAYTNGVYSSDAFPFGAGLIGAYLKSNMDDAIDVEIFKYPQDLINKIILENPDVIGFTNYSWTLDVSYKIATIAKKRNPNIVIVFGGPNYDFTTESKKRFWQEYENIDFYIVNEGEEAMLRLFNRLEEVGFDKNAIIGKAEPIGNCHYQTEFSQIIEGESLPRLDIKDLPSPYLMGLMDKFFDGKLLPLTHTTRGCPFKCTFCAEGAEYYNKVKQRLAPLKEELIYIAERVDDHISEILFSDANFGMFKDDLEKAKIIREVQEKYNYPRFIHVSTGKNMKERVLEVSSLLNDALRGIGAALQSTDPEVLENVKRSNISLDDLSQLSQKTASHDASSFTELILGLPGDTKEKHFKTLRDVVEADIGIIRMYQAIMLPQTEMYSQESREKFGIQSAFRIMPRSYGIFDFDGEKVTAVESEEIIIATNTMPYEDYLECREMNLFIEIFHNGGPFSEVREIVRLFGLKWFDFLLICFEERHSYPMLSNTFKQFREDTISKYWKDKDALKSYVNDNIDSMIGDTRGSNEMAKAKSISFFKNMSNMHKLIYDVLINVLMVNGHLNEEWESYINDLRKVSFMKRVCLHHTRKNFSFFSDWDLLATPQSKQLSNIKLEESVGYSIRHFDAQKKIINDHVFFHGATIDGLSRMIMFRVNYNKIFRSVVLSS